MAVIGKCKLCKTSGVELQESHIIPKWAYKRLRDYSPSAGNPNPIVITDGRAAQVSNQITEYLLCRNCEQRFGQVESYISEIAYSNDGTPIPLQILGIKHDTSSRFVTLTALDIDKIKYFAASVIWRAHVSKRKLSLGDKYGEDLRSYLHGSGSFPNNFRISIVILDQPIDSRHPRHNVVAFPTTKIEFGYHRHAFYLCGLYFEVCVGRVMPSVRDEICLNYGKNKLAGLFPADEIGFLNAIGNQARSSEKTGKLK